MDVTKDILKVMNKVNKPIEPEEIAFRVRSTESIVKERLDMLAEANVVEKEDDKYSIKEESSSPNLEKLYSY